MTPQVKNAVDKFYKLSNKKQRQLCRKHYPTVSFSWVSSIMIAGMMMEEGLVTPFNINEDVDTPSTRPGNHKSPFGIGA